MIHQIRILFQRLLFLVQQDGCSPHVAAGDYEYIQNHVPIDGADVGDIVVPEKVKGNDGVEYVVTAFENRCFSIAMV